MIDDMVLFARGSIDHSLLMTEFLIAILGTILFDKQSQQFGIRAEIKTSRGKMEPVIGTDMESEIKYMVY